MNGEIRGILICTIVIAFVLLGLNISNSPGLAATDIGNAATEEKTTVYIGVIPRDNPRIEYEKYQPIIDYLGEATPYEYELVLRKTSDDIVDALAKGVVDIAFLGPLTYLHAHSQFGAIPVLRSIADNGEPFYRSVIVVRESSPIENLSDLEGKRVAFAYLKSTSGNLIPRYLLADAGIHLSDLNTYKNFNYHDSVAKWVLKGEYDAGGLRESVADRYLPLGLRIISVSEPISTGPIVASPNTNNPVIMAIKEALLKLSTLDNKEEILRKADEELKGGFIEARDEDYSAIRNMINAVPKTCGVGCHPDIRL